MDALELGTITTDDREVAGQWSLLRPRSHSPLPPPFPPEGLRPQCPPRIQWIAQQRVCSQDAEHVATHVSGKLWNTLWSMEVFTQVASNIKGLAHKFAQIFARTQCERGLS